MSAAGALAERILGLRPAYADASHLLGLVAIEQGDYTVAERHITRAIEASPGQSVYYYNLGLALSSCKGPEDALSAYDQALLLNPDFIEAHINRGLVLFDMGRHEAALSACESAIRLDPGRADPHYNRGNALHELGRKEEALAAYDQALALNPSHAGAHNNRGNELRSLGRSEEALAAYDRVLVLDPDNSEAHTNRGNILGGLGRPEEALAAYDQALVVDPDNAETHKDQGSVLILLGRLQEASDAFKTALKYAPELESAAYLLAAVLAEDIPPLSPRTYIEELFNGFADDFDNKLVNKLSYRVPEQLFDAVCDHTGKQKLTILDLGCGTGLCAVVFAAVINRMVGVDLAPRMLDKARERSLYAELIQSDVHCALEKCNEFFDLILAADVFIYIGALEEVFSLTIDRLTPGGLFAFSVEVSTYGCDFSLGLTGRYTQSTEYIRRLAINNSFEEVTMNPVTVRYEGDKPVAGYVVVLRRPGNSLVIEETQNRV